MKQMFLPFCSPPLLVLLPLLTYACLLIDVLDRPRVCKMNSEPTTTTTIPPPPSGRSS